MKRKDKLIEAKTQMTFTDNNMSVYTHLSRWGY